MRPIHPFPARMAPEIALEVFGTLPNGSRVLDPMCGSGTVIRQAVECGFDAVGLDIDPLAVIMTRAWTSRTPPYRLLHDAQQIVARARAVSATEAEPSWDAATAKYAEFWFGERQRLDLSRLAHALKRSRFRSTDILRVCFSRTVITKDSGASLARDVSHSRPHRVRTENEFDVFGGFIQAARRVADRLHPESIRGNALVKQGDARTQQREIGEFDVVVTSPPYLNAIDYMRGHRLSLIWFGHQLSELTEIRSAGVGAERASAESPFDLTEFLAPAPSNPGATHVGWVRRYASDMTDVVQSIDKALRPGGRLVLVVGNSTIRGTAVDNAGIVDRCAQGCGLEQVARWERAIPNSSRYLPTPADGALALRMRSEVVLSYTKSAELC